MGACPAESSTGQKPNLSAGVAIRRLKERFAWYANLQIVRGILADCRRAWEVAEQACANVCTIATVVDSTEPAAGGRKKDRPCCGAKAAAELCVSPDRSNRPCPVDVEEFDCGPKHLRTTQRRATDAHGLDASVIALCNGIELPPPACRKRFGFMRHPFGFQSVGKTRRGSCRGRGGNQQRGNFCPCASRHVEGDYLPELGTKLGTNPG